MSIHGCTPTELLERSGVLGQRLSAVHATHLTEHDIQLLGGARSFACFCPTTERDLADGVGPSRELADAGCELTLGSDSHAVIDPFEEMRAVELNERLVSQRRGHWSAPELLRAGGRAGHRSLGFRRRRGDPARPVGRSHHLRPVDPADRRHGVRWSPSCSPRRPADITSIVASGRLVDMDPVDVSTRLDTAIAQVTR